MEEKQMRRHIFCRNMCLWGGWAFRSEAVFLLTTAICGTVIYVMSETTDRAMYYMIFFLLLVMEMYGMMMQQTEYARRQFPLALSFGAGRTESVWGMQLANLLLYVQVLLALRIGMQLESVIAVPGTVGIRDMEGMGMPVLAGTLLFVAAIGQLMTVASLKWEDRKHIWQVLIFLAGISLSTILIVFIGSQILYAMDGKTLMFFGKAQKVFPALLFLMRVAGPVGLVLYVFGFFQVKKALEEYEV